MNDKCVKILRKACINEKGIVDHAQYEIMKSIISGEKNATRKAKFILGAKRIGANLKRSPGSVLYRKPDRSTKLVTVLPVNQVPGGPATPIAERPYYKHLCDPEDQGGERSNGDQGVGGTQEGLECGDKGMGLAGQKSSLQCCDTEESEQTQQVVT